MIQSFKGGFYDYKKLCRQLLPQLLSVWLWVVEKKNDGSIWKW